MRRSVFASLAFVALLVALLVAPSAAQEATPEAGGLPAGASIQILAEALVEELPPAPADVVLVRLTIPPGATIPLDPALALVHVESGAVAVRKTTGLTVTQVTVAGTPVAAQVVATGVETVFGPGDAALFPPFVAGEILNPGAEPAVILVLLVEPVGAAATPVAEATPMAGGTLAAGATPMAEEEMAGVAFEPLAFGHVEEMPSGPAVVAIAR